MSSTGKCFDIGKATREAITAFENRQREAVQELVKQNKSNNANDDKQLENYFRDNSIDINFGDKNSAGNGSLMRVAPIPLFYSQSWTDVKKHIDAGTKLTHGDEYAIEACRFYAGLIWHAINGVRKDVLLDPNFYRDKLHIELHGEIQEIAEGSYKNKKGYEGGIRGKGYVVNALEAALWAFYNDNDSFEKGVLLAVNLGDDTDTTAAIYGQLAGAVYGLESIPKKWVGQLFQAKFIMTLAKGLYLRGHNFKDERFDTTRPDPNEQNHNQTSVDNTSYQGEPKTGINTPHPVQSVSAENTSHGNKPNSKNNSSDHKKRANTISES
jgi:ADP-ribosylglycohydrolase